MTNNDKNKLIPGYWYHAIIMRYRGETYAKIKEEIYQAYGQDFHEGSIRNWFHRNGILHDMYREYADEMIKLEKEEAKDFIRGNVTKAVKTLAKVMAMGSDASQVAAAKIFLDRALGPVPTELTGEGLIKNVLNVNDIDINTIGTVDFLRLLERMEQLQNVGPSDNKSKNIEKQE